MSKGTGDMEGYASSQTRALELQKQLLLKLRGELPEAVTMQRERTAAICFDLAEQHKRARKFDKVRPISAREVGGGSAVRVAVLQAWVPVRGFRHHEAKAAACL